MAYRSGEVAPVEADYLDCHLGWINHLKFLQANDLGRLIYGGAQIEGVSSLGIHGSLLGLLG